MNVAVIGTGFGADTIVPAFSGLPGVKVVAICGGRDTEKTRAVAEAHRIPVCRASVSEICAMPEVDLVAVASPHACHFEGVHLALEHGKHIVCEKPLALTSAEIEQLIMRSRSQDRLHLVNHQLRFLAPIADVRRRVSNGEVGRVYQASLRYRSPRYLDPAVNRREWWFRNDLGGGMMLAMGPHLVDLIQYWFGDTIVSVSASADRVIDTVRTREAPVTEVDTESAFACHVRLADGASVFLSATAVAVRPMSLEVDIYGSAGEIHYRSDGRLEIHTLDGCGVRSIIPPEAAGAGEPQGTIFQQAYRVFARALAEAVATGDRVPVVAATDFADYAYKHRVLAAIKNSCREGRTVPVTG
jgi:predicted dehydrogenase